MEFGVYCPNMHHGIGLDAFLGRPFPPGLAISRETMAAVADLAEATGFDALWFGDHVIFPSYTGSSYPIVDKPNGTEIRAEPVFDPLAVMAWVGARTQRIRLGLSVLVVPYRNPVVTAKFFASLDVLTEGRIVIGAGVGVMEEEFEALDAPYKARGAVTDEYLRVRKAIDGEVLAELPKLQGRPFEERLPISIGLKLIDHHRPVRAAVARFVGLPIAIDIEGAHHDTSRHGPLEHRGADHLALPRDILGQSDIDRYH